MLCRAYEAPPPLWGRKDIVYVFSEPFTFVLCVRPFNSPGLHGRRSTEGTRGADLILVGAAGSRHLLIAC